MEKIEMLVSGKRALVDQDQVQLVERKQMMVAEAMRIKEQLKKLAKDAQHAPKSIAWYENKLSETMTTIIKLNRRIRQNIIFIKA